VVLQQERFLIVCFLSVLTSLAQQPAAIQGTVTDSSGAVIPGVTVSLTGEKAQRAVETAGDGTYAFNGLAAGDYTLKVDHPGLESFEQRITVVAGRMVQFPIQLRLRIATQSVTVTGAQDPELSLDPGESTAATVVKDSDLEALPDDPDDLRDMIMALAGPGAGQILVDGFSGGQIPAKSSIKEIRMNQNEFSLERDWRWGGPAAIEIITKPGADKFHGSAGITDSDAAFNSRNPYAANKASYVNRTFTGNLAGAMSKRASYTLNFYQSTINNTATINAVTLDPVTLLNVPVQASVLVPRTDISGTGKLDYQISTNHTFTGSYRNLSSHRENNGVGQYNLESRGYPGENSTSEVRLRETAVLSNSTVSETRFGYTRGAVYQYGETSTPSLVVAGAFSGGSAQVGRTSDVNTAVEVQNGTTLIHNTHTIRFGGGIRHISIANITPSNFGGTFSFFGVTDAPVLEANNQPVGNDTIQISSLEQYRRTLLFTSLGYPSALIRSLGGGASQFSVATGNPLVQFGQTELGLYAGDDWRARPDLTIAIGVRYQAQTNIHDLTGFMPRGSISWSPGAKNNGTPKTVFRLGSGVFDTSIRTMFLQQTLRFNGTTERQFVVLNPDSYPAAPANASLAAGQSLTTYQLDPHLKPSSWFLTAFTFEQRLPAKTSLSVIYRDQRTTHMLQTVNINTPLPDGVRPYGNAAGNIFQYESGGNQKVKWVFLQAINKPNPKISLTTQYTYMSAHNEGDDDNGTPSNPYNFQQDWGRAGWNAGSYFNLIGTLTAPYGVQFSQFLNASSGSPYNLTTGSDRNLDTLPNDRPAFATDLSRPSVVFTRFGAFDTDPLPGQTIVPRNYLTGAPRWNLNLRVSKTFSFGKSKDRYTVNFNIDVNNVLNHLNPGGYVGNLASPQFGESTAINVFSDTSNNRKVQLGAQFTF